MNFSQVSCQFFQKRLLYAHVFHLRELCFMSFSSSVVPTLPETSLYPWKEGNYVLYYPFTTVTGIIVEPTSFESLLENRSYNSFYLFRTFTARASPINTAFLLSRFQSKKPLCTRQPRYFQRSSSSVPLVHRSKVPVSSTLVTVIA